MVNTFILNTDLLDDEQLFNKHLALMPEKRRDKVIRMAKEKQKLSLGAGILIKAFVGDDISYNEYGKPISDKLEFNISHSGKYVVISTASEPVGVDIQIFKRGMRHIAHRFFSVEECITIDQSYTPDTTFIKIWSLKEAFLKCVGIGLCNDLNNFSVKIDDDRITVSQNFNNNFYYFKNYEVEGYQLSVCCEDNRFANTLVDVTEKVLNGEDVTYLREIQ